MKRPVAPNRELHFWHYTLRCGGCRPAMGHIKRTVAQVWWSAGKRQASDRDGPSGAGAAGRDVQMPERLCGLVGSPRRAPEAAGRCLLAGRRLAPRQSGRLARTKIPAPD